MLYKEGALKNCFNVDAKFIYSEEECKILFDELMKDQKSIEQFTKEHNLEAKLAEEMNIFPRADIDENVSKANQMMYQYVPMKTLFGKEKEFEFNNEFFRVANLIGVLRNVANKTIILPYFNALPNEEIQSAMSKLGFYMDFDWKNDNVLVKISKLEASLIGIQPLMDGNHKTAHALIQYYLGQCKLPSILRNNKLKEHYQAFLKCERAAIEKGDIMGLVSYYYYNIRERQEQICENLNIPQSVIGTKVSIKDEPIEQPPCV